jgi:hypothetical protein
VYPSWSCEHPLHAEKLSNHQNNELLSSDRCWYFNPSASASNAAALNPDRCRALWRTHNHSSANGHASRIRQARGLRYTCSNSSFNLTRTCFHWLVLLQTPPNPSKHRACGPRPRWPPWGRSPLSALLPYKRIMPPTEHRNKVYQCAC